MAAVIGARLAVTIKEQHTRMTFNSTTFWSDSITVLRWLYSPSIRLQQFVAPRVSEIQEISCVNDWRYVPTSENVADDGTKWNDIDFSSPAQRWLIGPKFLYQNEDDWPAKFPEKVDVDQHRILIATLDETNKEQSSYYVGIIEGVSSKVRASLKNYRMVIAWVRRFANNVLAKWKLSKKDANPEEIKLNTSEIISPFEIREAEHFIYKEIQKIIFKDEISNLSKGLSVKQSSKIYALNAFLDGDGLVRSKTRMSLEESLPYDMRCPPILPNKHETVHALLVYIHEENKHIGTEGITAQSRSQVWIIHVKAAVQRVRTRCLYCINQRARQQFPPVAPLPSF
ncbi:hypothetical protein PVAND_017827 [Polypedilum vanderplanki]|uniref:Integrase zinc-binding domain-containing protein n=1 Tax=Polypedilum vanderplanki TaxID=319348 RepID=A0A9J6B9K5_POLVA|nr:hypothetical protein PVAND_017827 [Polypedilum vanderplanki]